MCGQFALLQSREDIEKRFKVAKSKNNNTLKYSGKFYPSQRIPVIIGQHSRENLLTLMKWGLVPSWAKDPKIGSRMFNARAEGASKYTLCAGRRIRHVRSTRISSVKIIIYN